MPVQFPENTDRWIEGDAPRSDLVVSSRARLARNLPQFPFVPRANKEQLAAISETLEKALRSSDYFKGFTRFELSEISSQERKFLRESHLISGEMEKGLDHRAVYVNDDAKTSIMVNEEDHLRIQTMLPGLQIAEIYHQMEEIEEALEAVLEFAYSAQFGYLTACPTNTGTGLRVSVMVHLVALVMTNQAEEALGSLGNLGLVVRGAYGEHSAHSGDLFQISNEVTLGRTEENLVEVLQNVIDQIIGRESTGRELLLRQHATKCEDVILRAIGVLSHARTIDSNEAIALLSRIRLGVNKEFGLRLTHSELNRLLIDVQPAHLVRLAQLNDSTENGDKARAAFLREKFGDGRPPNEN